MDHLVPDAPNEFLRRLHARTQELVDDLRSEGARLAAIEHENRQLAQRCATLERQTAALSQLYAALHRLHETLEPAQVVAGIEEIVNGIVGSEELAILEPAPDGAVHVLCAMGIEAAAVRELARTSPVVAATLADGQHYLRDESVPREPGEHPITASVPLTVGGDVTGALIIFNLLAHKSGLAPLDHEILSLLATQAARALYLARLHSKHH